MTDHAQRARDLWLCLDDEIEIDESGKTLNAHELIAIIKHALTQAHAAGRRAGLEEAAAECQQRQVFCQSVLNTADHRAMSPGEQNGWYWKRDLLRALVEWCCAKAKEGA